MREHLATFLDDFRRFDREVAVVRMQGNRRRSTSYGELAHLAGRFAAFLEDRNIGPGDRVLLWAENGAEWIASFYGCLLRGVLIVPLDAYGNVEFAERVVADVRPKLAVGDAQLLKLLKPAVSENAIREHRKAGALVRRRAGAASDEGAVAVLEPPASTEIPTLTFEDWTNSLPLREGQPVQNLNRDTPLQILFTSGTTGDPKGIVHTHGNVLASVAPIEQGARPYLRYEPLVHPLRILHTLPLSHVFGQTMGLWVPAILGAEVHFETRLIASRLIDRIKSEKISVLAAVPRVMQLLKTHLEARHARLEQRLAAAKGASAWGRWWSFRDVHRTLGLKFWALVSGGGALPGPLEQFWNGLGLVVIQGYGMTETTALITLNHPFHVASGTIGKPLPGREVKIGPDGEVLVRGPMISTTTWTDGALQSSPNEWLATGDLAEEQTTGELRFLGRKSEVIVTAAGVNIHPEDLEAALEQEPGVKGCAVVPVETANGPEPFAVLAMRGSSDQAAASVQRANSKLAEFQRITRFAVWPEPDLPRTSTGKVRRKAVAAWVSEKKFESRDHESGSGGAGSWAASSASRDWLWTLIEEIATETPQSPDDSLRLAEDLHLDSLGRVQLAAALEERLGEVPGNGAMDQVRTLGELRALIRGAAGVTHPQMPPGTGPSALWPASDLPTEIDSADANRALRNNPQPEIPTTRIEEHPKLEKDQYIYPRWPWWKPVALVRNAFLELVAQPLVWYLAQPRVFGRPDLRTSEPMLIVCNHVTAYDSPLVQYALPGRVRRKVAAAMSGEMLEDFRHFRNPDRRPGERGFLLWGPAAYFLVTALFNVFPLPRKKNFQRSFLHAGEALDRGYNVLVFPEGTRSAEGTLADFRPGIGLLAKESQTAVLPVAIRGLGELKARGRGWFRSGKIEIHVGQPMRFRPTEPETAITEALSAAVRQLLDGQ